MGTSEATEIEHKRASIWATETAIDRARLRTEALAFESFVGEFEGLWRGVLNTHAASTAPTPGIDGDTWYRERFTGWRQTN